MRKRLVAWLRWRGHLRHFRRLVIVRRTALPVRGLEGEFGGGMQPGPTPADDLVPLPWRRRQAT